LKKDTMATKNYFTGNGSNRLFDISVNYGDDPSTVVVTVDGVATPFAWVNPGRIELASAPASGASVVVARVTDISEPVVVFNDTAVLLSEDLNQSAEQSLHKLQEISEDLTGLTQRALVVPPGDTAPLVSSLVGADGKLLGVEDGIIVPVDRPTKGDPGGDASQVGTRLEAATVNIAESINMIRTTGFATRGDGGAATYVRWQSGFPALVPNQEGFAWFESADGAQWVNGHIELRPEMFGALGHPTNDEGLAIRRMFEFASGRTVLITKTHRYKSITHAEDIRIYSNTKVQGISALTCGFKRIPNIAVTEAMAEPSFGVYWQDADNVEINDIFHDVQRSGLGHPSATSQRVNGFLARGQNGRWRVNRCIVHNATGYAFYTGAVGAAHSADGIFTDCIAYNSQVSFEETGLDTNVQLIRCHSLQYVNDGGSVVPPECGFHQYGGIAGSYHYQCTHRGPSAAVLAVLTDAVENRGVVFEDCDFETDLVGIAAAIVRNDAFGVNGKLAQADFIGGRVVNLNGPASDFTAGLVKVDGPQFIGRTAALGVGQNSIVSLTGDFDIQCIEPITASSGAAAIAAVIDGTAVVTRTPTGSIKATHLNGGPEVAVSGTITLVGDTVFDPPIGGVVLGTEAPRHIQRKKGYRIEGPSGATDLINAGGNTYWSSIVMDAIPTGWTTSHQNTDFDKVTVRASLEREGLAGVTAPPLATIQYYRRPAVTQGEVFFVIKTDAALPAGTRLRYDIVEEA
jgi:hypothetical protein